jgi:3-oxoacyl-[acyl-carrier protein] reductase
VLATVFDATDAQSIVNWCTATSEGFGGVDCLVVNAGGPPRGVFDDFDDGDWMASFELTILSAVRMIRAVLPSMRKRGGGSILTITSATVKEPGDMLLMSNVMRSGVTSLAKSLSRQLAGEKIRVNNLVPGRIDTERSRSLDTVIAANRGISLEAHKTAQRTSIPLGRYGTIEEFGKVGAFLLSDAAGYINGATVLVDGGKTQTVW